MKRRIILPMLAVIAALAVVVGASAFVNVNKVELNSSEGLTTVYFEYKGISTYTSPSDWDFIGGVLPEEAPCEIGQAKVCVLAVPVSLLSGINTMEEQVADFLLNYSGGPEAFVDDDGNTPFRKD